MSDVSSDRDLLSTIGIIPEKECNSFTLRLKSPGGRLEVAKIIVIATVAENFGEGAVNLTACQGLEIPGVAVDRLDEAIRVLKLGGVELGPPAEIITDNRF